MHPASADTHTLVWIFHGDEERKMYLSTAKNKDAGFVGILILAALCGVGVVATVRQVSFSLLLVVTGVPLTAQLHRTYVSWRYPLTTLRVQCRPGSVRMTENYGEANRWRDRVVFDKPVASFQSATWVSGGCFLEMKGVVTGERGVTLPMRLFPSAASIEGFMSWASAHGLAVEGVPPLPGGYER